MVLKRQKNISINIYILKSRTYDLITFVDVFTSDIRNIITDLPLANEDIYNVTNVASC